MLYGINIYTELNERFMSIYICIYIMYCFIGSKSIEIIACFYYNWGGMGGGGACPIG